MFEESQREKTNSTSYMRHEGNQTPTRYTGLQITLMSMNRILESIWIPNSSMETTYLTSHLYVERYQNNWYAYTVSPAYLQFPGNTANNYVPLVHRGLCACVEGHTTEILYTEYTDEKSSVYHNYYARGNVEISIGRTGENDIMYDNHAVSRCHARLQYVNGIWEVEDMNSSNGVYVNQQRVQRKQLKLGDCIFIVGLQIIIGTDFISLNDGNDRITMLSGKLTTDRTSGNFQRPVSISGNGEEKFFSRVPRKRIGLKKKTIEIEGPPMALSDNQIPLLLQMGSSMVMGGASALSGNFLPLVSTMLFPTLTRRYTEKERKEYEVRRVEKYGEYLKKKETEIQNEKSLEEKVLNADNPDADTVLSYAGQSRHLWERRPVDNDYLDIRIGNGVLPMQAEINYPKQRFTMDEDELETKMLALAEKKVYLSNVPVIVSLKKNFVVGMKGDEKKLGELMKQMIIQLAVFHSYDEVKIILLTDPDTLSGMRWAGFLPHVWNDQKNQRFIATNLSEAYQIGEYLKNQLGGNIRELNVDEGNPKGRPWYVVFANNKKLVDSLEFLNEIMQNKKCCGISVVAAYDMPPKDSTILLDLQKSVGKLLYLDEAEREDVDFVSDVYEPGKIEDSMKQLSNTLLKDNNGTFNLPQSLSFLEMFQVGKIEQLQILKRWRESDPVTSLAVPVGIGTNGSMIELDLHEKYHGPHGLVAGTTGSGKSEFLLTYILSLAINFHPDEVAFVLIDYKGGGLAGAFVDETRGTYLPHVVGTITNLDGSAISRSLISIQSELIRRQEIFQKAKETANVGTMDIYNYQRLYRRGVVNEPMPHLMIISDEFAELKAQQPEFMDQLISIARIGRSLGIHLILATQKPAGIVNDQIRSNAKFKVCLKVQDRSDSMDMLQRPDAIEIKETGRFYLQVGYNESFLLGQSGWSGAPYIACERSEKRDNEVVSFIDHAGQIYYRGKQKVKKEAEHSQLVAIVKLISDVAKASGYERKMLWKPTLPEKIPMVLEITKDPDDTQVWTQIGYVDNPMKQSQNRYRLNLTRSKNLLLIGEAGSGKTTLLQTMLLQATANYTPEELQYYIFDYTGGRYRVFDQMPHCGAVINEENSNMIGKCFAIIEDLVKERKELFRKLEAENYEVASRIQKIPLVLVVIDDITGFVSYEEGERYYGELQEYMKKCASYGIVFVLASSQLNDVFMRIRNEIGTRIVFHQKTRYDYSDALEKKCEYEPPELPGRGLVLVNEEPLEYQAAMFEPDLVGKERNERIKAVLHQVLDNYQGDVTARRLPMIPKTQTYEAFSEGFKKGRIPLGYSVPDARPVALPLKQIGIFALYFGNPLGRTAITENILQIAKKENMDFFVVKKKTESVFDLSARKHVDEDLIFQANMFEASEESLKMLKEELEAAMLKRKTVIDEIVQEQGLHLKQQEDKNKLYYELYERSRPILVYFESFPEVCRAMDDTTAAIFGQVYLKHANRFNLSFVGGFEPKEKEDYLNTSLFREFGPGGQMLLMGGSVDQQQLVDISDLDDGMNKVIPYNVGVMHYQNQFHPILMPCGEIILEEIAEDDAPIF